MVVLVRNVVRECGTFEDGAAVRQQIEMGLMKGDDVTVSFEGIFAASSSFVNGAFVKLLDKYPFHLLQKRLRIVESTPLINELIRKKLIQNSAGQTKDGQP